MLVEFGTLAVLITLSMVLLFSRLKPSFKRYVLEYPIVVDFSVFAVVYFLHSGTFAGGIIAAMAAFFTSVLLTIGRKWYRIK